MNPTNHSEQTGQNESKNQDITFLLRPPVNPNEVYAANSHVSKTIEKAWSIFQRGGITELRQHITDKNAKHKSGNGEESDGREGGDPLSSSSNINIASKVNMDPRPYQQFMYRHAIQTNTIVSLGTGQGKTLIAILTIRHFASQLEEKNSNGDMKQTWFLVPSVALAVQQANTLKSNLPYRVGIACHTASHSDQARNDLSNSHIIVATHGSALDLMSHYSDSFYMGRINLLIIDECHYAVKDHNYASILRKFYHTLPVNATYTKPRILGLTASPIINISEDITDKELDILLQELETTLDSTLVSLASLGLDDAESGVIQTKLDKYLIQYESDSQLFPKISIETLRVGKMHKCRKKELNQLYYLHAEFGPRLVMSYISAVLNEVSRNHYEQETVEQYEYFRQNLELMRQGYVNQTSGFNSSQCGKSPKLKALERLLNNIYNISTGTTTRCNDNSDEIVGIIFVERRCTAVSLHHYLQSLNQPKIRTGMLARQTTHIFKYMNSIHKINQVSQVQQEEARHEWLHAMQNTKKVLDQLRTHEINILIATSVVEEGIDVSSCSFVCVLDGLKTTKQYIQMKGRARQLNAKFFVFNDSNQQPPVTLSHAHQIDNKVSSIISKRCAAKDSSIRKRKLSTFTTIDLEPSSCIEEEALIHNEYRTQYGIVDTTTSKSLLNRYVSCIPKDLNCRKSREAMQPYLPCYDNKQLCLPSHLPEKARYIILPEKFQSKSKKKNECMLAMIGVIRLHRLGLINDRLLPLKRDDLLKKLMASALIQFQTTTKAKTYARSPYTEEEKSELFYYYPIIYRGVAFDHYDTILGGNRRSLCVVSSQELKSRPCLSFDHKELGVVQCQLGDMEKIAMTRFQFDKCNSFYEVVMNSRWRRRTGKTYFRLSDSKEASVISSYTLACVTKYNTIDWTRIDDVVNDYHRSEEERHKAAKSWNYYTPRLWAPLYDPNNTYIVLQKDTQNRDCSTQFPDDEFDTYRDYYLQKRGFSVDLHSALYHTKRLWSISQNMTDCKSHLQPFGNDESKMESTIEIDENGRDIDNELLVSVNLPCDACMEAPVADASICLHMIYLPQVLYEIQRFETATSLKRHCTKHLPIIGGYLEQIPTNEIVEAITAKSCALSFSYDRLEYLGDAVLKLLQTDSLLNAQDEKLKNWIHCLHEGDLSALRSAMGCNERLKNAVQSVGLESFILTKPLGRGLWLPSGLEVYCKDESKDMDLDEFAPSNKAQADVLESLLGLIYLKYGYKVAGSVSRELGVCLLENDNVCPTPSSPPKEGIFVSQELQQKAEKFVGISGLNHNHIMEAVTHPSKIHSSQSNYQRLEWVGDSVLCLAAREWVYDTFPDLQVKELVQIETTIICNETLSLIGTASGLHRCIDHCDSTLPTRLEEYEFNIENTRQGLWGTDPPKVIADVVEAFFGVVHIDYGFDQGQESCLFAMNPMLTSISNQTTRWKDTDLLHLITHPKQQLYEKCPGFKVRTFPSHEYCRDFPSDSIDNLVWYGKSSTWESCSERRCSVVGVVSWQGYKLCAIASDCPVVARNRVCALVSGILQRDESLLPKLCDMSKQFKDRR